MSASPDNKPLAVVTGVGPGTGSAIVRRFAQDYRVAMIARNQERLAALSAELPGTFAVPCDVSEEEPLLAALTGIRDTWGDPAVVIHNAVGGAFGDPLSIKPKVLQKNFEVNTMALLHLAQTFAPGMIAAGGGTILCTGNTSAYRGKANFAGFAPTKAAQRILSESLARSLGPKGIHVAYLAIDAVIDLEWTRERWPEQPDEFFCKPADIAHHAMRIVDEPRSAWTFDSVIRPFGETW